MYAEHLHGTAIRCWCLLQIHKFGILLYQYTLLMIKIKSVCMILFKQSSICTRYATGNLSKLYWTVSVTSGKQKHHFVSELDFFLNLYHQMRHQCIYSFVNLCHNSCGRILCHIIERLLVLLVYKTLFKMILLWRLSSTLFHSFCRP